MQRKIKFRGKDIATEKWVYGYLYRFKGVYTICENIRYTEEVPILLDTVGQYTGLKDKNGKEIYEGDIVQAVFADEEEPETKGVVVYVEAGACYMVIANNGDEWDLGYLDKIEKIGNKWDNPELLEEGE